MNISVSIKDKAIAEKILWFLDSFRDKGVEVSQLPMDRQNSDVEYTDEFLKENLERANYNCW